MKTELMGNGEAVLGLLPLDDFAAYVPLRVAVMQRLKTAILDGTLKPGFLLSENAIAAQLSVSRTPVREALRTLEQEGLVSVLPGRKVIVSMPTMKDIREIYDIRLMLESEAIRRIVANQNHLIPQLRFSIEEQLSALDKNDRVKLREINSNFHKLITSGLGNSRMEQSLEAMHDLISRFRRYSLEDEVWAEKGVAEHDQLVSFLEKGDAGSAIDLLTQHIITAQQILETRFLQGKHDE